MNNARLLAQMDFDIKRREIEGLSSKDLPSFGYVPLGFIPAGEHEMVPTYPMGLPLMILGMSGIVGWGQAANAAMVLNALLAVVVLYWLSIEIGLSRPLAALGTIFLGLSSLFVLMSVNLMSDVPALTWCSLAVLSGLMSQRNSLWAVAAGAAFSMCVLIRPANVLLVAPLAVIFGLDWRRWLLFGLGGVPGAIFQAAVNLHLYGSILTTGYGDVGSLFRAKYLGWSARAYAQWLPVCLTPALVLLAGVFFIPALRGDRRVIALMVWVGVFLVFYAFYFHTSETWWYLRFVLPAFSPMIVLVIMVMRQAVSRFSDSVRWTLGLAAAIAVIGWNIMWFDRFGIPPRGEKQYQAAASWANENLPHNAVVLAMQASGSLMYYTRFTLVRSDQFERDSFAGVVRACDSAGRPIYAVLFPFEVNDVLSVKIPGRWTKVNSVQDITIWRREGA
jgi:hypothetical protein